MTVTGPPHALGQALARAHDVGRVHCLVGGHQHEPRGAAAPGHLRHVQRAQHIGTQRLDLVEFLHQRHVLVGRGVEHYGGLVPLADGHDAIKISHVGRVIHPLHLQVRLTQFLLEPIDCKLRNVHAHQAPNPETCDLPTQL